MSKFMDVALKAVKAAEEIIIGYYSGEIKVQDKADGSPVTIADKEAEEKIRDVILRAFPDHVIYGEEGEKEIGKTGQYTWIVDPIDGTKSFIRQHGFFGTLLALFYEGEIILGISNMPVTGELLYAEKGQGAFLNGSRVKVSELDDVSQSYMSFGTVKYFTKVGKQDQLLDLAERMKWARSIGDCWSYHLLAQGKIDVVVEGYTKIWDVAPFKIIIEEAGGKMTTLSGGQIDFTLSNNVATNGHLHDEIVAAFR